MKETNSQLEVKARCCAEISYHLHIEVKEKFDLVKQNVKAAENTGTEVEEAKKCLEENKGGK